MEANSIAEFVINIFNNLTHKMSNQENQENQENQSNAAYAASQPSLIEHFSIDGLFGYRSVSFNSKYAAAILIARNGSSKTTLIAALDAFLRGQFTRFTLLDFEKITCKLRGVDQPLVILKTDIDKIIEFSLRDDIVINAKKWEVEPIALIQLLEIELDVAKTKNWRNEQTFNSIYEKLGYDLRLAKNQCEKLSVILKESMPELNRLREIIRSVLGDTEIVYLPTYRRIELSLSNSDGRFSERRKDILSRLGVTKSGLYTADIQFGLSDISDRLRNLYSDMLRLANQGYGKVSANVINDLITGNYKGSFVPKKQPTKDSLEIFFSRIKDTEQARMQYAGRFQRTPYSNFSVTPDWNKVYSNDIPEDSKPFLTYFLDQLNSVIQETRGTEELVEAFINRCNKYLFGEDESTEFENNSESCFDDKKELTFNRSNLEVKVNSLITKKEIPMESLSSGEKQMISLFARLYLYPGPKIVLIDEPELSLSLDWQRNILPDVLVSPTCTQVIAITHSPFIFDNELENFAGSIHSKIDRNKRDYSHQETSFENVNMDSKDD